MYAFGKIRVFVIFLKSTGDVHVILFLLETAEWMEPQEVDVLQTIHFIHGLFMSSWKLLREVTNLS